jgi:peptidoglycan hydrolase-like protein with peptidoglycan-binding domain
MIKAKKKQVISVQDWDDLVEKTYGKVYSFQQQEGCKPRGTFELTVPPDHVEDYENDTVPEVINGDEMGVSFAAWLARDPKEWNGGRLEDASYLDLFWMRNFYPDVEMVATDLYNKGLLPAGEYLIDIDW